jgi:hypothetical protein
MMSVWTRPAAWSSLAIIRSPRLRSVPARVSGDRCAIAESHCHGVSRSGPGHRGTAVHDAVMGRRFSGRSLAAWRGRQPPPAP